LNTKSAAENCAVYGDHYILSLVQSDTARLSSITIICLLNHRKSLTIPEPSFKCAHQVISEDPLKIPAGQVLQPVPGDPPQPHFDGYEFAPAKDHLH
uniref:MABP domain-containing protein n=1 Tax=Anisakis simplex TaxID=6269 RepID=A0A0M3JF57_ANISI